MTTLPKTDAVPRPRRAGRYSLAVPGRPLRPARHLPLIQNIVVPAGPAGDTWIRLYRPAGASQPLPVLIYVHGDDAPFSDLDTHLRAYRLAAQVRAAVVVVDYSLAPSARLPVAIEENYVAAEWLSRHGDEYGVDGTRIALGLDASGVEMSNALLCMARARGGPELAAHVLSAPSATAELRAALAG